MNKTTTNSQKGPQRLQPHPFELRERGYRLYVQGKSHHEIAEALGIPVSTLARWSSKEKWKLRKHSLGAGEINDNGSAAAGADWNRDEIAQLSFVEKQRRYSEGMSNYALRVATVIKNLSPQALILNADKVLKLDSVARKALNLEENKPVVVVDVGFLANGHAPRFQASNVPVRELQDCAPTDEEPKEAG